MGEHPKQPPPPSAQPIGAQAARAVALVIAAVVVVSAVMGGAWLLVRGGDDGPTGNDTAQAEPSNDESDVETTVTELQAPAGPGQARCAVPSPRILARHQLAFDGTVDAVADGEVRLAPTRFYAGRPTDLVVVEAPPAKLRDLLLTVDFEKGERYLVAADRGRVSICGYSGPWSEDLEKLYLEAFPG